MKREEILALEPGWKLDRLVSLKIMGYEESKTNDGWVRMGALATYPKRYSSDISAAWEVVEKMYSWGGCDIGCYGKGGSGKWITVSTRTFSAGDVRVTAHTAPEAICKAALLAVLEEEQEK